MNPFDPRVAVITGIAAAIVSSHRVRAIVGRGAGYAAAGAIKASDAVVSAGRDIYEEASEVAATHDGTVKQPKPRAKAAAGRSR
jgi:hypothetical protein